MRLKHAAALIIAIDLGLSSCAREQATVPSAAATPAQQTAAAKPSASPTASLKPGNLKPVDAPLTVQKLKNARYYILANEPTLLKNGIYENKQKQKFKLDDLVAYGDINQDKIKDAVGTITIERDARSFTYLVAIANDRGEPKNIASEFLGEGVKVKELTATAEKITLKMDKDCCPKQEITRSYNLKDIKPVVTTPAVKDGKHPAEKKSIPTASPKL